jgi:hypothetical protein
MSVENVLEMERIEVYSLAEMESNLTRETCDFFRKLHQYALIVKIILKEFY